MEMPETNWCEVVADKNWKAVLTWETHACLIAELVDCRGYEDCHAYDAGNRAFGCSAKGWEEKYVSALLFVGVAHLCDEMIDVFLRLGYRIRTWIVLT